MLLTKEQYETICRYYDVDTIEVSKLGQSRARYLVRKWSLYPTIEAPMGFRLIRVTVNYNKVEDEEREGWKFPLLTILFEREV